MSENQTPVTTFSISEDRARATVQVGAEALVMDADALQNLIGHLGALRAQLQPPVAADPPENSQFLQIDSPVLEVRITPDREFVGLLFRTPTYGWIGYSFRRADALKVADHIAGGLMADKS